MAFSWQEETYAAGTTDISVDIEYLDKSYINVYLDGVLSTAYSWSSDVLITLTSALSESTVVTLVRRTDKEALYIAFGDGAAFIRENLDTQNTQFLHLAQELVEGRSIDGFYGDLSMNGYRITNLGTPTSDTDAVNKVYVDGLVDAEHDARVAADNAEYTARVAADVSLQSQITGSAPVLSAERSVVSWHGQHITNSVAIPDNVNAFSIGPQITIEPGQEVTVGAGSYWNVFGKVLESDELYNVTANNLITEGGGTTVAVDEIVVDSDIGTLAAQNSNSVSITGGSIAGITDLAIADGGTGASTAPAARTNLGLGSMATQDAGTVSITGGSITGITDLAISDGGTGASTAAAARTNLGLGTIATQSASSVAITGGSIAGITDLAVADGGTGSSTAAGARSNLGAAASGANTDITSLAGTTAGTDAAAGKVGEVLTATTTATALTSSTATNVASLVLTAGDWDLDGTIRFNTTDAAMTALVGGFNLTSATQPGFPDCYQLAAALNALNQQFSVPRKRINVSTPTTVYLVGLAIFGSGSVTYQGSIRARRAR